jgi:hypothetical protein
MMYEEGRAILEQTWEWNTSSFSTCLVKSLQFHFVVIFSFLASNPLNLVIISALLQKIQVKMFIYSSCFPLNDSPLLYVELYDLTSILLFSFMHYIPVRSITAWLPYPLITFALHYFTFLHYFSVILFIITWVGL